MLELFAYAALLLAVLAVALLLFAPILVSLRMTTVPQPGMRCELRLLGGMAPRIRLSRGKSDGAAPAPSKKPRRARKRLVANTHSLRAVRQFLMDVVDRIHLSSLEVDCEFGCADPADTGRLAGVLLPVAFARPVLRDQNIVFRPNFERACLDVELMAAFRLTLAAFILPLTHLVWRMFGPVR